jgi:hypothetical protein
MHLYLNFTRGLKLDEHGLQVKAFSSCQSCTSVLGELKNSRVKKVVRSFKELVVNKCGIRVRRPALPRTNVKVGAWTNLMVLRIGVSRGWTSGQ